MFREWLVFPKALAGGVVATIFTWIVIICYSAWRETARHKASGIAELGAVSGGWNALLHSPLVLLSLSIAFALGLYLGSRH